MKGGTLRGLNPSHYNKTNKRDKNANFLEVIGVLLLLFFQFEHYVYCLKIIIFN